jgi:O-antigen ligase
VSFGHPILAGIVATLPLVAFALGQGLAFLSRVTLRARMIGLVCLLLLASTFVWRTRTTQALDTNPLDKAAMVRIAFVALAALCAFAFLFSPELRPIQMPLALKLLGAYIVTAALAALSSPLPLQALYRVFELSCGFLAIYVAFVLLGDRAGPLVIRLLMGAIGVIVAVIWLEALLVPTRAWSPTVSVVAPYELQGYLPSYSTNAVGTFGALLAIWGLARPGTARRSGYWATAALIGGLVTLVAAQYRTGIVGFVAAAVLILWYRRRVLLTAVLVVLASAAMFVGWSHVSADANRVFSKGRPELVGNLDSRTLYWHAARPLIAERPIYGWGLNVGSRRVLVSLGDNVTSTIHSTWVEAVLGTGFVGASFLALAFLTALGRAWQSRQTRLGLAITAMLVFMIVRSLTGTTTEIFDFGFMVFASLAFSAEVLARDRRPVVAPAVGSWRVNEA